MVINGYKIAGTTDLSLVEMDLQKARRKLQSIQEKEYYRLLGKEIAFLCDSISLERIQRDPNMDIYTGAVNNLDSQIRRAQSLGLESPYNLSEYLQVMTYEGDTYLRSLAVNPKLRDAYKSLEDYSVSEEECKDPNNKKYQVWSTICGMYQSQQAFTLNLTPDITPDKDKIIYPDKKERAETIARQSVTSHYLNQISGPSQIPPERLMDYLDEALEKTVSEEGRAMENEQRAKLMGILIDFKKDKDFVFKKPGEPEETEITDESLAEEPNIETNEKKEEQQ